MFNCKFVLKKLFSVWRWKPYKNLYFYAKNELGRTTFFRLKSRIQKIVFSSICSRKIVKLKKIIFSKIKFFSKFVPEKSLIWKTLFSKIIFFSKFVNEKYKKVKKSRKHYFSRKNWKMSFWNYHNSGRIG